jgi:hypothetical protein
MVGEGRGWLDLVGLGLTEFDSLGPLRQKRLGGQAGPETESRQRIRAPILNRFFIKLFWLPVNFQKAHRRSRREQRYLELPLATALMSI